MLLRSIEEDITGRAACAVLDGAVPLAENAYEMPIFETFVRRTIIEAARKE